MLNIKSFLVSDVILNDPNSGDDVTPLKLIKLAYICHGFHLAVMKDSLIAEPVEAWRYGPVVPGIYDAVKHFRGQPIDRDFFEVYSQSPKYQGMITDDSKTVIGKVLEVYGKYSAEELSALTHKKGSPWDVTVKKKGMKEIIPSDLIYEYYRKRIR